jgi:hypothetical protein
MLKVNRDIATLLDAHKYVLERFYKGYYAMQFIN